VRSLLGVLRSESVATSEPLIGLIEDSVTPELVTAVAREHKSGRRLYIGTTNLDTQTFNVWNMGAIATRGDKEALDLFRKVLLASASIPILTPPVVFDVEIGGETFDELHADGGVLAQFFVPLRVINLPEAIEMAQEGGFAFTPRPRMFVIRNARFTPVPEAIERRLPSVARRTVSSLIQAMGRADLFRLFAIARARGNDFHYTEVPSDFVWQAEDEFDGDEMRRLFGIGFDLGQKEDTWQRTPPGLFAINSDANN